MKTIEERAKEFADRHEETELNLRGLGGAYGYDRIKNAEICAYERGAKEQKVIETKRACNIFCHIGCPHETDDYDCLKDKCAAWKKFRRMMEE